MAHDHPDIPTIAARAILALVDGDTTAALAAIRDVGDDPGRLRDLALALAQFRANTTTPDDAAELVQITMDRQTSGGDQ